MKLSTTEDLEDLEADRYLISSTSSKSSVVAM
jgi:hypothetical protein